MNYTTRPWNSALKYGLWGAFAAFSLYLLYYILDETLMWKPSTGQLPVLILIIFGILAASDRKKAQSGFISFGTAFLTSLLAFVIGMVLYSIGSMILTMVIDPGLFERSIDYNILQLQKVVDSGFMTQEQIDVQIDRMRNSSTGEMVIGFVMGIGIYALLSAIIFLISSAIIRKEEQFS